jgi:Gpi18-like mannosyltransferase
MEPSSIPASTMPWVLTCGLLFLALCGLAWRFVFRGGALELLPRRAILAAYVALLLLSLGLRLALSTAIHGVPTDVACFKAWAMAAAEGGLSRFYSSGMFVDYPPGYVYVLQAVGLARSLLGLQHDSPGFLLLVKLPAMALDLVAAGFLLWLARTRTSLARACALSLLYAFNPAAIHNSAVYGQVDVFLALPLALALALVVRGAMLRATAVYAVAVLIKPQALLLGPLALLALVRRRDARVTALAVLVAAATLVVLVLPFSRHLHPLWLVDLYRKTLASYPYATLNAANLYALLGANWAPLDGTVLFLSYGTLGTVFLAAIVVLSASLYLRSRDPGDVVVVALLVMSAAFFLAAKMHERYLYPAVLIAATAYAVTSDARLLALFAGYSTSVLLNQAILHDLVARTGSFFVAPDDLALRLVALLNAALLAWTLRVAADRCLGRAGGARLPRERRPPPAAVAPQEPARLSRLDLVLMGALSLAYAAVAFTNLGARDSPQRCWSPSRAGETSYLDLGGPRNVGRIRYFMGLGEGSYSVALSADGLSWGEGRKLEQPSRFEKLEWRTSQAEERARYLRVTADKPGAMLCEIAVLDARSGARLPLRAILVPGAPGTPEAVSSPLADEPDTARHDPSFYSGMYFDEVYHARAAYELLLRMEPSETTHPPLGKAIIAAGVAVFGMTPFGWRFMGTLFGVAMVPLLYLLAHRLFRRTGAAFLASFLLAVDFLHFVQTRVATIDTYGVFFILLMYYFMHQYLTRDFWRAPMRQLLLPLLLSGVAFGLGAASKWTVLYGGAGLAVLLAASLVARWREYREGSRLPSAGPEPAGGRPAHEVFFRRAASVLAWCLVSFVLVPGLLYLLAYVPFMLLPGPGHGVGDVLANQAHMYDYHSKLTASHPFASPWWQWPIMRKPVWYYAGEGLPKGMVASIVAMGNPAVWWPGIAAVGACLYLAVRRRDATLAFILVGLAAQFLPWAVAPRKLVFIYHFFPSVPFLILAVVYAAEALVRRRPALRHGVRALAALALGLFVLFYPILSATPVRRAFVLDWLRWFDSWFLC